MRYILFIALIATMAVATAPAKSQSVLVPKTVEQLILWCDRDSIAPDIERCADYLKIVVKINNWPTTYIARGSADNPFRKGPPTSGHLRAYRCPQGADPSTLASTFTRSIREYATAKVLNAKPQEVAISALTAIYRECARATNH